MNTHHTDPAERSRASVRRWYAAHREEYAELRRKRYKADPKRRAKARKAAAAYRKRRASGLKVQRVLTRELDGVPVTVHTSGYVADRVGVKQSTLRGWERAGWIPESVFPDRHRMYTDAQISLIRLFADTVKSYSKVGVSRTVKAEAIADLSVLIHKMWRKVDVSEGKKVSKKSTRRRRLS